MSLLGDLEKHLLRDMLIKAAVGTRVFGVQVPDNQELPYVLIERPEQETKRTSGDSIVSSTIVITSFDATAEATERLAELIDKRMQVMMVSTPPARTIDAKPEDDAIEVEPERGNGGIFRYAAPLTYRVVRQVPRRS